MRARWAKGLRGAMSVEQVIRSQVGRGYRLSFFSSDLLTLGSHPRRLTADLHPTAVCRCPAGRTPSSGTFYGSRG